MAKTLKDRLCEYRYVLEGHLESWLPLSGGFVIGFFYYFWGADHISDKKVETLFGVVISVAAIAVGFLGTAKSILFSIDRHPLIVGLKDAKQYPKLIGYMLTGIWTCLFVVFYSSCLLLVDFVAVPNLKAWLVSLWFFSSGYALLSNARIIYLFSSILKSL